MNIGSVNESGLPARGGPYRQLWSVVDGAVRDALGNHPDYLTGKGRRNARTSIVKRVTGTVLGFAVEAARSLRKQADKDQAVHDAGPASRVTSDAPAGAFFRQPANFDLPSLIVENGRGHRYADTREYRNRVAGTAQRLDLYLRTEGAKRHANANRASGQERAGQL